MDLTFSILVDVRVPDLCQETKSRRAEGIIARKSNVRLEITAFIRCSGRSKNGDLPVIDVTLVDLYNPRTIVLGSYRFCAVT